MTSISYINPYFRAPSPPKPLKSSSRYQNLPGEPLTAHSDHRGPLSDLVYPQYLCLFDLFFAFVDLCSPYVTLFQVILSDVLCSALGLLSMDFVEMPQGGHQLGLNTLSARFRADGEHWPSIRNSRCCLGSIMEYTSPTTNHLESLLGGLLTSHLSVDYGHAGINAFRSRFP